MGHTKFSPDWCFGLLKQKFRYSEVNCLDDLVSVVNTSSSANTAQLVGKQSGEVIVPTYSWNDYFSDHMRKIQNITTYHHFLFTKDQPGDVVVQEYVNSPQIIIAVLKPTKTTECSWNPSATETPSITPPSGLSEERQLYLFEKIREFCSPSCQDLVCPKPQSMSDNDPSTSPTSVSAPKKQRICSKCKQPGHNIRSCKM